MTDKKSPKSPSWNVPSHDPERKTEEKKLEELENPWARGNDSYKKQNFDDQQRNSAHQHDPAQQHDIGEFGDHIPPFSKKKSFFSPLVLAIIAIFIIGFFGFGFLSGSGPEPTRSTQSIPTSYLIYKIMWLVVIGASIFAMARRNLGQTLKHALSWGFIILLTIGGVNIWKDMREQGGVSSLVGLDNSYVEIPRQADGHYYVRALVNGHKIRFVVDTGASAIVLSKADGVRAGFNLRKSDYRGQAQTANGTIPIAPIRLDTVSIGSLEISNVRGWVNGGPLETSLLGMSFLNRLSSFEFKGNKLILNK